MTPAEFKQARKRLGLSANGMARALGLSDGRSIRRIESGETAITGPVEKLVAYLIRDAEHGANWPPLRYAGEKDA